MEYNFSIGFNGNKRDLDRILSTGAQIESVYSGGLVNMIAGGRSQYADSIEQLTEVISFAKKEGVKYEIALNSSCGLHQKSDSQWWEKISDYVKALEYSGVDRIIASHPFIISLIKAKTSMEIVASTICEITEPRMAAYYEDLGADIIIPSMNVNYNLDKLNKIKRILKKARLRIMLNEHCLGDCPWRRFHHSSYAHGNYEFDYHVNCKKKFLQNHYLVLTNNCIRPEDMHNYFNITNNFKIVGRLVDIDLLIDRILAYQNQSYTGNYVNLSDENLSKVIYIPNKVLKNLFEHKSRCDFICDECEYCKELCMAMENKDE